MLSREAWGNTHVPAGDGSALHLPDVPHLLLQLFLLHQGVEVSLLQLVLSLGMGGGAGGGDTEGNYYIWVGGNH